MPKKKDIFARMTKEEIWSLLTERGLPDQEYYQTDEIEFPINKHRQTIQRYIRDGQLKAQRVGKQYLIEKDDLLTFLELLSNPELRLKKEPEKKPAKPARKPGIDWISEPLMKRLNAVAVINELTAEELIERIVSHIESVGKFDFYESKDNWLALVHEKFYYFDMHPIEILEEPKDYDEYPEEPAPYPENYPDYPEDYNPGMPEDDQ